MGWLDNLFKGKTQSSKKEFEAKRANVLARCYKTKEQLASEERLSYDDKDKQAFEDWIDGKAGFFLQSLSYPKSILQKLNDDITLDDIPYLSDVEKSVLEGLKKKVDSGDFDFYDLSRIMQNKTLFDDELFEALTTKIAVNNLPDEPVTYRYLEKAGYSKDEAFDIINLFNNSDTINKLYNNPNTPDIFPNGRNEIEIYLENKVRDVSSAYASARLVKSVLANCPGLQNNGLAQYIEEKFTEYDEILTKHDFAIQNLEEINPYIDLLDVSSAEARVPDIHATIKSAVTRLFEEKPDYSFPIFNYGQLNSYMSRHTENFFDLPETLFNKIINNSAQKDISFFDAAVNSLGERQGHYLSFKYGTIGDGYYNDDLDYANIKLLLDKGYGSEGARAALLERIAKIEEAYPSVIEVYKEKYGAYLTPAANEGEKQQDAENQTPHILHDNLIGDYIRKEDWISHHTTSEGKKIGEIFYLSEDGREYAAVQDAGIIKIATFYTEKGRSEEYRYYDGKLSSKTKFYEDGGEDQETFNKETGKRETLEIRRVPEKRKGTDDTRWTLKNYTRYLEDGETVKKREIYDIESDSHITLYNEEYDADTQKRTITEYQDQKPSRIVTYKNDKQIRVEKYENGKLWEVYQSADEQSDAYGPGRTFEAYSKEGILESICRYDGDTPAETTFYEKDGKTVSKIEHRYKDRREARTDQYAGGKLADVIFYDGEGKPLPKDTLLEDVRNHVIETQTASTSAIQQKYAIGYNRASRLMEVLEAYGVVGPYQDGKREVLASSLSDIHETIPAENAEDKQPTHSPEEKAQEQTLDSTSGETPPKEQNDKKPAENEEQQVSSTTDEEYQDALKLFRQALDVNRYNTTNFKAFYEKAEQDLSEKYPDHYKADDLFYYNHSYPYLHASDLAIKKFLIEEKGCDVNLVDQSTGSNALIFADKDNALYLIQQGIDINHRNKSNELPLKALFNFNEREAAQILIENGSELENIDDKGHSALDIIAKKKRNFQSSIDLGIPLGEGEQKEFDKLSELEELVKSKMTASTSEKAHTHTLNNVNETETGTPTETPASTQTSKNEGADEEKTKQTLEDNIDKDSAKTVIEPPAKEQNDEKPAETGEQQTSSVDDKETEGQASSQENPTRDEGDRPSQAEDVPFVPYDMAEREAFITEELAEFENKLEANGVPERLRKAQRKSEKKNLAQVYAFDYVDEKIGEYNEISTPDLVKVLEDLTVQENNEKLDDEDLKDFINDLVSESQWRIDEFMKDEDKSQYSAAELKALQELSTFNAKLYKGKIEEQNKAKFDAFTQAENVLAEELGLRLAAGETLDSNVNHETGGDAGKEAIVNPVSQNEDIEKVDDAAKAAAEAARVAKEKEEQKKQQEAEKVRLEQEELKKEQAEKARQEQERKAAEEAKRKQKEDEESQQKPNEGDTPKPNPHQKWEEKLKTVKEKGDIHTLLAFAAEVMQNESDFKDYKYKGAKNEKINAFAWLSENIDRKSLPKHNFESITPSEIDILQNLAQARIDEFRFTSKNNYSLIGVQAKKEGNVFVDLLLDEAKSFTKNKNKIIGNAKNEEQKKELLEKLKKWQELYQSKLHKKVYVLDENNRVEDLLKLLEEEIGKLQQSLENTGNQHNDDNGRPDDATSNGDEGRIDDDGENKDDDAVSINVGGEDLKPDDAGGSGEDEEETGGDDGNDDDTPDDAEPIIELDDFDELVVNHAAEPEITPSTETLADLLEQKLDNKQIFNKRDDNNFALFAQEEDKNTPEKATGRVSVAGNKNIDIISRDLDVYKAAVEAAKAKGAKKIAITSNNADGSPRDLSDSDAGKKNREALAHLFLACAKSGLEAQTTPEIETALQAYPEYQTYQLAKAKDEAYTELSLKLSRMSPAQQDEYKQKKDNFKNAPDDVSKRAAQADLLRFETNNGISALKQKVKDATLAQYNYYIENGNEYGAPTDDASKANRKMQIKNTYDKYQNRGDRYQDTDDGSEIKGTRVLEIAMYKRLINETTL